MELNQTVTDFELPATNEKTITLSNLKGRNVVLYFYPKDSTPGCTLEGKDFRDHYSVFQDLETDIFGISRDKLTSHQKFKCKHNFPFELISDRDSVLCDLFDVLGKKTFFGKEISGIIRSTFLIDKTGKLRQEWRRVKVKGHVEEVLQAVKEL